MTTQTAQTQQPGGERVESGRVESGSPGRWSRTGRERADQHWNCFNGNAGDTPERRGGAHNYGLSERIYAMLK